MQFSALRKRIFFFIPLSITFLNPKILGFLFPTKNSLTWGVKCENETSENRREFIKLASKFVREWNGHLEIFSLPQVIENSRQYLLLQTDILQKTVVNFWVSLNYD